MEFVVSRSVLQDELSKALAAVAKKTNIPILSCVRLETLGNGLQGIRLTSTNMETTIFSHFESKLLSVTEEGAMCIPAKRLVDIVRLGDEGPMKISSDETGWVRIRTAKSNYRIPGMDSTMFPELPSYEGVSWVEVPAAMLKIMIPAIKYSISTDESRLNMQGAKLEISEGQVNLHSTDGARITIASGVPNSLPTSDFTVVIPVEGIDEIQKLISEGVESVGIGVGTNCMFFRVGSRILSTRLMIDKFPGLGLPFQLMGTYEHSGTFKADELSRSIRRALVCAKSEDGKKKIKAASVLLEFEEGELNISAADADLGEAKEKADSNFTGIGIQVYLNGEFLRDFLDPAGVGEVKMEIKDDKSPVYLSAENEGVAIYCCLMPMR